MFSCAIYTVFIDCRSSTFLVVVQKTQPGYNIGNPFLQRCNVRRKQMWYQDRHPFSVTPCRGYTTMLPFPPKKKEKKRRRKWQTKQKGGKGDQGKRKRRKNQCIESLGMSCLGFEPSWAIPYLAEHTQLHLVPTQTPQYIATRPYHCGVTGT